MCHNWRIRKPDEARMTSSSLQEKSKWYVYELVDPRSNKVFYVGKGKGNRMFAHERDAEKGICSKKTNKIKQIWKSKLSVLKRQVAFFWDESAAYDHETDLIEYYGLENLTNIMPGGGAVWTARLKSRQIRRSAECSKPIVLHEWIAKQKDEAMFMRFADWFSMGLHETGCKIKAVEYPKMLKFNVVITEAVHNLLLPVLWKMIVADESARNAFSERMKPYGVRFENGCA